MKITMVIDNPIPAFAYGGTQRVVWCLMKELSKMGHKVVCVAPVGSYCDFAEIAGYTSPAEIPSLIPTDTDVVHFHAAVYPTEKPYIVTIHGNLKEGDYVDRNAVFVSRNHAERNDSKSFVYNGLDWKEYGTVDFDAPRLHWHFLAKAAWRVKNVKGAIGVVKMLPHERLYVLGGYRFNFKMGLRFTFHPRISFRGMVGGEEKLRIMKQSKGLLFPVVWDEPFGLALIESLYCGSPVYGTPYGSLPEIVLPDVGYLTNNGREMAERMLSSDFSQRRCHEYAAELFNSRIMAERYLEKYQTVMSGKQLNEHSPTPSGNNGRLEWKM